MLFKKPLIALDIGSSSVKLCEVKGKGEGRKLQNLGLEMLPPGTIVNGEIVSPETLLSVTKKLFSNLNINTKGRRVSLSLSGGAVILKKLILLLEGEEDLTEQVFEEAKQQFHHDMNDMYFRHQEISSAFAEEGEKVFLVAAGKIDVIEQYIDFVHRLGMRVGITDTEIFCLSNVFEHNYPESKGLTLIVNIGATTTQVVLTFNNEYLYSREFFQGGNLITGKISEDLSIDFESAEGLKISASTGDEDIARKILESVTTINNQIVQEIKQTVDLFIEQENIQELSAVDNIFLSGGAATGLDMAQKISSTFQAPVQILNPFNQLDTTPSGVEMDYLLSQGAIFTSAVGLGLRQAED